MTTEHITPEQAVELADRSGLLGCELSEFEGKLHAFALAAIAWGREQRAKELPVLPGPEYRLSPDSEPSLYDPYDMQAYGAACAAHARDMALSEAMQVCKQLEAAIDGGGNTYYRPADARQCVSAIEVLKGK